MEKVIGVGRVLLCGPCLWLGAFVREHVVAVFGLIVHAVETCQLQNSNRKIKISPNCIVLQI